MKYDYNTFKELFDQEIHYAYESQYGVRIEKDCIIFHKLTLYKDGTLEYKGQYSTFDSRLWSKVKILAELLIETPAEKILFKP
jgi:hypothetical protein